MYIKLNVILTIYSHLCQTTYAEMFQLPLNKKVKKDNVNNMICSLEWQCFERCSSRPVVLNDPKAEKSMQIREIKIKKIT